MPKRNKKSVVPADDFDEMLAEFKAADLQQSADVPNSSSSSSSRSGSGSSSKLNRHATEVTVSEETIINACQDGDVTQLRRWARQGVRVVGADPLCHNLLDCSTSAAYWSRSSALASTKQILNMELRP
jgi:hypothetical protein